PSAAARQAALIAAAREAAATRRSPTGTPRPPVTPQEAAALRAVLAARRAGSGAPGAARGRRRPPPPRRRPAERTVRRRLAAGHGTRWRLRGSLAALGLVLPLVAGLLWPATQPVGSAAEPSDAHSLALAAHGTLLDAADRYRSLERDLAARRAELQVARTAEAAARERLAAEQAAVGTRAADLYRAPAEQRDPLLGLSVRTPSATSDVLYRAALDDRGKGELESTVVRAARAERDLDLATRRVAVAAAAVAAVEDGATAVLADARDVTAGLRPDVAAQLAALGTAPATAAQVEINQEAVRRWQEYLGVLAGAGIEPPPAASLADPAGLPTGLAPALDGAGRPVPGVAWAIAGNRPVTVLSAETVAAVSSALAQVGKPFVPGGTGPDTYDCGGLAATSWLLAGHALPAGSADQWARGAAVPLSQLQVGDLVFADGGTDVGIHLGEGQVVAASAATYQVGVRSMPDAVGAVRVTLAAPAQPNAALPAGTAGRGSCAAPPVPAGPVSPAWGGWSNGTIPLAALCSITRGHALRCDAAAGYAGLAAAFETVFGRTLCITDSYRSLPAQVTAFRTKPGLAAVPGTSNHGWALAVDLCGGINVAGTPQSAWMAANAGLFGFVQPDWARPGGEKPEPWHWEFGLLA
ncbi:NlpC/P60 family protein, partial [Geodermatophilus sp. CPCC 205506]|uniref:NlpC/P60 family protein n=1 Tax=Geodermatophilus sp. CPCC 205506 TaxID=2936596 RepID=UPI003F5297EA